MSPKTQLWQERLANADIVKCPLDNQNCHTNRRIVSTNLYVSIQSLLAFEMTKKCFIKGYSILENTIHTHKSLYPISNRNCKWTGSHDISPRQTQPVYTEALRERDAKRISKSIHSTITFIVLNIAAPVVSNSAMNSRNSSKLWYVLYCFLKIMLL